MTRRSRTALVAACALLGAFASPAQERVPPDLALRLLMRVLAYDRNITKGPGEGDFVVLIAYEPGQKAVLPEARTAVGKLGAMAIAKRPIRFVEAEFKDAATLAREATKASAGVMLFLPGLSQNGQDAAAAVAKNMGCHTLSLDPRLVERSLGIGVFYSDGHPKVVMNVASVKAAHSNFEVALLKVSRLIRQ